jgi:nucleotide-binding universal stress UspA family protein
MAKGRRLNVLVATDGSVGARAALATTLKFPWPAGTRAFGVVAGAAPVATKLPAMMWTALNADQERIAAAARRTLGRRWRDTQVSVVKQPPVPGIMSEARRRRASIIVVGSHGMGAIGRFLIGSVSRGIVRDVRCSVLVVTRRVPRFARFVVGLDGSANAHRALDFMASLAVPPGGRVDVVRVVEPLNPPSVGLMPSGVQATLRRQVDRLRARALGLARRDAEAAATRLERAGWKARAVVRTGVPLHEVLAAAIRAHCLVVGARGVGGTERLLLGSVAEGVLDRSRVPVVVMR